MVDHDAGFLRWLPAQRKAHRLPCIVQSFHLGGIFIDIGQEHSIFLLIQIMIIFVQNYYAATPVVPLIPKNLVWLLARLLQGIRRRIGFAAPLLL